MTINSVVVKLVALIVFHSCCSMCQQASSLSSDSATALQLSHFNVDSAPDKMSPPDFDQYLGSYIADGERIALILDYDGTLAELAAHPNLTQMTPEMKSTLQNIVSSGNAFVAVISGRDVYGVREKIGIENIIYSGNHGLEVLYPDGTKHNQGISKELTDNFTKMIDQLTKELAHDGAWVEDKKVSLTFHFRQVDPKLVPELEARAIQIIESYGYRANHAHACVEGKPPIKWNKGKAAEYILAKNFDAEWRQRKVIFAGDDTTDEDVMQAIKGSGRSFRVSKDPNVVTHADFRITSVGDVYQLLKWIEGKVTA